MVHELFWVLICIYSFLLPTNIFWKEICQKISENRRVYFWLIVSYWVGQVHGTYIRWWLRTCCACMKMKVFSEEKDPICDCCNLSECFKQILLLMCAPISELPSKIRPMVEGEFGGAGRKHTGRKLRLDQSCIKAKAGMILISLSTYQS